MKHLELSSEQLGQLMHKADWEPRRNQKRFLKDLGGEGTADELDAMLSVAADDKAAITERDRLNAERKKKVRTIELGKVGRLAEMLSAIQLEMERKDLDTMDVAKLCGWSFGQADRLLKGETNPAGEHLVKLAEAVGCRWELVSVEQD